MHAFSTNYPRHENSIGEKNTFEYIEENLASLNISTAKIRLDAFDSFHSFSSITSADFSGTEEGEVYLVFPVNHIKGADRENSGAAGLSIAMALCRSFADLPPKRNTHILFLGAESGNTGETQLGTRAFLQDYFSNSPAIFLYVDIRSLPAQLDFQPYGTGAVSPAWLVRHSARVFSDTGIPYSFSTINYNIHQLGINTGKKRIDPYLDRDLPAIYFGGTVPPHAGDVAVTEAGAETPMRSTTLSADELTGFFRTYTDTLPPLFPSEWDRHYLFFKWGNKTLIISELSYVLILLFVFAGVLSYPFFQRKRFYRYLRSLRTNSWVLPILFFLMFLYLLISTFVLETISAYRGYPTLWQQSPYLMLLLKIGVAVFLFSLSHRITAPFHLGRLRGSFYSASGLLFLLINLVILTAYNLSLTIYGALIFFLGFLFTIVRNRLFKALYLLLSVSLILTLLIQSFRAGPSGLMYGVLLSHVRGNLIISFHLLPYMLFFLRLNVLFHHPQRPVVRRIAFAFDLIFGILSVVLVLHFTVLYDPAAGQPFPVTIEEELDASDDQHRVRISAADTGGSFTANTWADTRVDIDELSGVYDFSFPLDSEMLKTEISSRDFLARTTYTITLTSPQPPERIGIAFESSAKINLYASDFPSVLSADREQVRFLIGRYPDFPFRMNFTVPSELVGTLIIETDYTQPPYDLFIQPGNFDISYTLRNAVRLALPPPPTD